MAYTLVLLRHGESEWNAKNLFTGWVDVPLSDKGRAEAVHGGELLKEAGVLPEKLFTSMLRRAIMTANLSLDAADRHWIPVERNWRLNERHYGALQGKNKKEIRDEYGEEQFMQWRRSYDVPPPPIEAGSEFSQDADPRYAGEPIPATECLKDVLERLLPYWEGTIVPEIKTGKTVMIAAHGNSLRAIVKHLDDISDNDIARVIGSGRSVERVGILGVMRLRHGGARYEVGHAAGHRRGVVSEALQEAAHEDGVDDLLAAQVVSRVQDHLEGATVQGIELGVVGLNDGGQLQVPRRDEAGDVLAGAHSQVRHLQDEPQDRLGQRRGAGGGASSAQG